MKNFTTTAVVTNETLTITIANTNENFVGINLPRHRDGGLVIVSDEKFASIENVLRRIGNFVEEKTDLIGFPCFGGCVMVYKEDHYKGSREIRIYRTSKTDFCAVLNSGERLKIVFEENNLEEKIYDRVLGMVSAGGNYGIDTMENGGVAYQLALHMRLKGYNVGDLRSRMAFGFDEGYAETICDLVAKEDLTPPKDDEESWQIFEEICDGLHCYGDIFVVGNANGEDVEGEGSFLCHWTWEPENDEEGPSVEIVST